MSPRSFSAWITSERRGRSTLMPKKSLPSVHDRQACMRRADLPVPA